MSEMLTPDHSPQDMQSPAGKPQRVLACLLCQQRKVRCDRKFPCANCTKAGVQCTSAALIPRQRRRRFPEKDLLDRLRHYEDLLRRHHIPFEPLHSSAAVASKGNDTSSHRVEARVQIAHTEPSAAEPTTSYKVTSVITIRLWSIRH
jgi:ribosomal protein L13E